MQDTKQLSKENEILLLIDQQVSNNKICKQYQVSRTLFNKLRQQSPLIEQKLIEQREKNGFGAEGKKHMGRYKGTDYKFQQLVGMKKEIIQLINQGMRIGTICKELNISISLFRRFRKRAPIINQAIKRRKKANKK